MRDKYIKADQVQLRDYKELDEKWVQDLIVEDPSILGLGDLIFVERERKQPGGGRLDFLFKDPDASRRYEVEIQLGATDETHIIRTIEYWDREKKRYPQYDHCAVLVAEDVTGRFFNVISLFNGTLPFIAIQMQALKFGESMTLVFTKVMDELTRGPVDGDEITEPTDRDYWENRTPWGFVRLADKVLEILQSFDTTLTLNYTKNYIGLKKNGMPYNFVVFKPVKNKAKYLVYVPKSDDLDGKIALAEFDTTSYSNRAGCYRLHLDRSDIESKRDTLKELSQRAYDRRASA